MLKFYVCNHCKKVIVQVVERDVPTICCGEPMSELKPNTVDAANEKHVPVVTCDGDLVHVEVGSVAHPMTPEHSIQFIAIETDNGFQIAQLSPEDKPVADFKVNGKLVAVYEYCNLHGLWKTEA